MKKKNYSKRAIAAANKYLANFHLTVEHLTEAQKQSVFHYVKLKRYMYTLSLYILGSAILICGAWLKFSIARESIQMIFIPPTPADASLVKSANLLLAIGIVTGAELFGGFVILVFLATYFFTMRVQKRTLDAFLCNIKPVTNDQTA